MNVPRGDDPVAAPADAPFDVPVERLGGRRGEGRRAGMAAIAIVALLGGSFGLARLSDDHPAAADSTAVTAAATVSASRAASPSARPPRSTAPRIEHVLDVPNRALDGAPGVRLVARDARDLRLLGWTPGSAVANVRTIRDAIDDPDEVVLPFLAPVGDRALLLGLGPPGPAGGPARVVDTAGRTLWSGSEIAEGGVWSDDGRLVALAGAGRVWHLVTVDDTNPAHEVVVDLPAEVFLPNPVPIGSLTLPRLAPRTAPIGFSEDGAWIYGGIISPELGILIGEFRVAVDGSRVEPVRDFGVGRPDGLRPQSGTFGGQLVDPATGRLANWRVNADTAGGPRTLEVRNADSGFAFTVDVATPLAWAWGGDGSLYVLSSDSLLYPNHAELIRVDPDGVAGPPLLETGPLARAGLIGVRDGWAAVVLWAERPAVEIQIVLVDLADPARVTALPLPADGPGSIVGAELRAPDNPRP
jgi:hypothetical protein